MVFICVDFMRVLQLEIGVKDRQQAPPHLFFAHPWAKLYVTMKYDFKRYDASIKVIHVIPYTYGFLKCLPCHLERLKSGTAVTSSHHFPSMKHTWSFCIFEIESIAHTSPQMVLSSRSMVYISLPKAFEFAFFFFQLLKRLMWNFGYGWTERHTCITQYC